MIKGTRFAFGLFQLIGLTPFGGAFKTLSENRAMPESKIAPPAASHHHATQETRQLLHDSIPLRFLTIVTIGAVCGTTAPGFRQKHYRKTARKRPLRRFCRVGVVGRNSFRTAHN
jgi:hypothetical protein